VDLPGVQIELINELAAANPNLVLVVISGGPCAVSKVIKNVKGLLYAIYPGQEGGRALADIICGRENPSGKLPVTIPKSDGQLRPCTTNFQNIVREGLGYRWFDSQKLQPEFAFGFGLNYTTFIYKNLRVTPGRAPAGQEITVQADITNTGRRAGEEVVQLYLSTGEISPAVVMPVKQLKGFKKVSLQPGETKHVAFTLTANELYIFDAAENRYRVPTGEYLVQVGGASDQLSLIKKFVLEPATELPDLMVANIRTLPAFPKVGDRVQFIASVFNRGTGPTHVDQPLDVIFRVNGKVVSTSPTVQQVIPAGGMALVCGSEISAGNSWTVGPEKVLVQAEADADHLVSETIETNNFAVRNRSLASP
jgi:beta-glucosidase